MNSETIVMCVVALLLGMLLANMLKNVCGCKNVVEGNAPLPCNTLHVGPGGSNWDPGQSGASDSHQPTNGPLDPTTTICHGNDYRLYRDWYKACINQVGKDNIGPGLYTEYKSTDPDAQNRGTIITLQSGSGGQHTDSGNTNGQNQSYIWQCNLPEH